MHGNEFELDSKAMQFKWQKRFKFRGTSIMYIYAYISKYLEQLLIEWCKKGTHCEEREGNI